LGNIFSNNRNIFLKLDLDGRAKVFSYYETQRSPGYYNSSMGTMSGGFSYETERFIVQVGNGELRRPRSLSFRKDMTDIFRDCPVLVRMIENREFKKSEVIEIASYYNIHCGRR
jgi:hypothetical protein